MPSPLSLWTPSRLPPHPPPLQRTHALQVWKLSSTDLCEVARSSVLHSGFPPHVKRHWVAAQYWRLGPEGNDIHKTNVPALRMRFRHARSRDLPPAGRAPPAAFRPCPAALVPPPDRHRSPVAALRRKDCHSEEAGLVGSGAANHAARLRAREAVLRAESA